MLQGMLWDVLTKHEPDIRLGSGVVWERGISDTQVGVSRPRLRFWKPWSQGRDRYRDFFYTSLNVETETETINFETETETQMKVVETIKDETREICLRLQISKLSRPRLFETMEISGCRD